MADLVIKISGDLKNYETALSDAKEKTESLSGGLEQIAKISGVAFAALTAAIGVSVHAFAESQKAAVSLDQVLQNQGIYTADLAEKYKDFAKAVELKTGIDDDAIVSAQVVLQGLIGQQEITQSLTSTIADLSVAKKIDLDTTATLIGKGIEGQTTALLKLGIEIDDNLNKEERTAKIIELVTQKYGGQAEAANKGLGSIKGLTSAFGDFLEGVGERFAPVIELGISALTKLFILLQDKAVTDFVTAIVIAGTVVSGLALAVSLGGAAFLALSAALTAAGIATSAMTIATTALVGATGLGLILLVASEIYLNWSTIWPKMQQIFAAFADNIGQVGSGLAGILSGIFHADVAKIKDNLAVVREAIGKGYDDITKKVEKPIKIAVEQDEDKADAAEKQAQREIEAEKNKQAVLQAERELALAKAGEASAQTIALKQQELDVLKEIQDKHNASIREALQNHRDELTLADKASGDQDVAQNKDFKDSILATNTAYLALDAQGKALFSQTQAAKLKNDLLTEKSIKEAYAAEEVQRQIKDRNEFLKKEQEFGTAYATLNQVMHSKIYEGTNQATANLAQLVNSKNKELQAIGKAASIAQIAIKTAESAMAIFAGFAAIPIVGPALGVAGAAAAVAFGAEQIAEVVAAADGGLITGGIPGVDSVPVLAQQGELVVPKQNFNEVINSVASNRNGDTENESSGSSGFATVVISLKDDLMNFIEAQLVERQRLNISLQGG